jgi:hypothetical protein
MAIQPSILKSTLAPGQGFCELSRSAQKLMTNESLEALIDSLNSGNRDALIFERPLSRSVFYARAWLEDPPSARVLCDHGYEVYFVKNRSGTFSSIVLDMGEQDIHVFTKAEDRRTGRLKDALMTVVFPHLRSKGRERQCVTYRDREVEGFLLACGFSLSGDMTASISLTDFTPKDFPDNPTGIITEERRQAMQARCRVAAALLTMVKEEADGFFDQEICDRLEDLAYETRNASYDLVDSWWNTAAPKAEQDDVVNPESARSSLLPDD